MKIILCVTFTYKCNRTVMGNMVLFQKCDICKNKKNSSDVCGYGLFFTTVKMSGICNQCGDLGLFVVLFFVFSNTELCISTFWSKSQNACGLESIAMMLSNAPRSNSNTFLRNSNVKYTLFTPNLCGILWCIIHKRHLRIIIPCPNELVTGILVSLSVRPSVRAACHVRCNSYSSGWIPSIFGTKDHLHERVCRVQWHSTLTYIYKVISHDFVIKLQKYGTFCPVRSTTYTVLDGISPYLTLMIPSLRGCTTYNGLDLYLQGYLPVTLPTEKHLFIGGTNRNQ